MFEYICKFSIKSTFQRIIASLFTVHSHHFSVVSHPTYSKHRYFFCSSNIYILSNTCRSFLAAYEHTPSKSSQMCESSQSRWHWANDWAKWEPRLYIASTHPFSASATVWAPGLSFSSRLSPRHLNWGGNVCVGICKCRKRRITWCQVSRFLFLCSYCFFMTSSVEGTMFLEHTVARPSERARPPSTRWMSALAVIIILIVCVCYDINLVNYSHRTSKTSCTCNPATRMTHSDMEHSNKHSPMTLRSTLS